MLRPLLLAALPLSLASAAVHADSPAAQRAERRQEAVAGNEAVAGAYTRLHSANRVLVDLARDVRRRSTTPQTTALAERVIQEREIADRRLLAFARGHAIDVGVRDRGAGDEKKLNEELNHWLKKIAGETGRKLDRDFADAVVDIDREMMRVAEDARANAPHDTVRDQLDQQLAGLRTEIGDADKLVQELKRR